MAKSLERITFEEFKNRVFDGQRDFVNVEIYGTADESSVHEFNQYLQSLDDKELINYPVVFENSRFKNLYAKGLELNRFEGHNFQIIDSELPLLYLKKSKLYNTSLHNVVIDRGKQENTSFRNFNLSNVQYSRSDFPDTDYIKGEIKNSIVKECDLSEGSYFYQVNIRDSNVKKVKTGKGTRDTLKPKRKLFRKK